MVDPLIDCLFPRFSLLFHSQTLSMKYFAFSGVLGKQTGLYPIWVDGDLYSALSYAIFGSVAYVDLVKVAGALYSVR